MRDRQYKHRAGSRLGRLLCWFGLHAWTVRPKEPGRRLARACRRCDAYRVRGDDGRWRPVVIRLYGARSVVTGSLEMVYFDGAGIARPILRRGVPRE